MTLRLQDISHAFGDHAVLDGVTAEAQPGRITVLAGPNAAGKTTLLRIATGLLAPGHGTVQFDGVNLASMGEPHRAGMVSTLTQRPRSDIPLPVHDVIALGRHRRPQRPMEHLIDRLELGDVLHRPYQSLSVGQQQRVGIARMMHQHESGGLLVLDEPTAPLDPRHASSLTHMLRAAADDGATVVLSMHDLASAASIADQAWLLVNGAMAASGDASAVLTPAHLEQAFGLGFELLRRADGSDWLAPES